MDDLGKTYKLIELVGVSETSTEDAIHRSRVRLSITALDTPRAPAMLEEI